MDDPGSESLFLVAEVAFPIYPAFHAYSRRHTFSILGISLGHLFTSFLQKYTSALAVFHGSQCSPCGVLLQQLKQFLRDLTPV